MTPTSKSTARFITVHSILQLDARHALARAAVLDPHAMHRTVMSGFYGWVEPDARDARAQMGILHTWSLDLRNNALLLIVQSRIQPDWSSIPGNALAEKPTSLTVDQIIRRGDTVSFRAIVNPARHRAIAVDTPKGREIQNKRVADNTPQHARRWFADRLQAEGADRTGPGGVRRIGATCNPERLDVKILPKLTFPDRQRGMKLGRAEIRGALTVTEPTAFAEALSDGIGKARAYGVGLILTRPNPNAG